MIDQDPRREIAFTRNEALEELLTELNSAMGNAERTLELPVAPSLPVIFVVGPPRSGTTLVTQWLAASGRLAWPTNLLSRFYAAPYLGARIQQLLTDPRFNYRNELLGEHSVASFDSDLGKTRGLLQPNEFWYFWRRFFPLRWPEPLSAEQVAEVDGCGFVAGLAAIEAAFGKPFAAKAMLLQYNLTLLAELLPTSIFLHVHRDPVDNGLSILRARERFWGTNTHWYSARPPGTEDLLDRDPFEQVAGQILFTHRSIDAELRALPAYRTLRIDYESFCRDTAPTWSALVERCARQGFALDAEHDAPRTFSAQKPHASAEVRSQLAAALQRVMAGSAG
ncbi:MAG: sulfotransferase [Pseudomonadota bacterium]